LLGAAASSLLDARRNILLILGDCDRRGVRAFGGVVVSRLGVRLRDRLLRKLLKIFVVRLREEDREVVDVAVVAATCGGSLFSFESPDPSDAVGLVSDEVSAFMFMLRIACANSDIFLFSPPIPHLVKAFIRSSTDNSSEPDTCNFLKICEIPESSSSSSASLYRLSR
jgi:hypothetical protein